MLGIMVQLTLETISKCLTQDVIDEAFKLRTKSEDNVKSVKVTRAAAAGEGLLSAVYRIYVTGAVYSTSFVVKALVNDLLLRKSIKGCERYFTREAQFFLKVLPTLADVQKSLGAKENIQNNVPICYRCHCDGLNDYILMEDLAEDNFSSNPENPTAYERDANLKVLAHLHAVSMALRHKRPDEFEKFANSLSEVYFNETNRDWYANFFQRALNIDVDILASIEDPATSIYYKIFIDMLDKDAYRQLMSLVSKRGDHPVFCHGDAWYSNFLSSTERSVAIDFQLLRCTSPVTDAIYLLTMCSNLCPDKESFLKSLQFYYDSLIYYLGDMGIDGHSLFSREDFNEELRRFGKYGLLAALTSIPLLCTTRCDVLQSFEHKYCGVKMIPLEELWPLSPITGMEQKMRLVNAVRIAVDIGFI